MTSSTTAPPRRTARVRGLASLAATLAVAVVIAACGSGETSQDDADDGPAGPARTVTDQYGTVEITGTPERVVASGNYETDTAIALGVIPVATGRWFEEEDGASPWRREMLDGVRPEIIEYNPDGYDVEETLAFEPDLVLAGFDLAEEPYQQLSAVVPTVSLPYGLSGEEFTRAIGTALDREEEAEQLIAEMEDLLDQAADEHAALDGLTISIAGGYTPGVLADATQSTLDLGMLDHLGLQPAAGSAGRDDAFEEVPAENWSSFDGDLFILSFVTEDALAEFEANELFQRIPAVRDGGYLALTDSNDQELLRSGTLPQTRYALEHLVPRIAELAG